MYGFGDCLEPRQESKELMEQYLIEYFSNACCRVLERSHRGGHKEIQVGDLIHVLKNDPKKYYRIPLQLEISKHINQKNMKNFNK